MKQGQSTALLTDHYELTMLQAALQSGVAHRRATFELFTRRLPAGRTYGVVAGIGRALDAVRDFRFTDEQVEFIRAHVLDDEPTLEYLRNYRFTGDISCYREGDLFFPFSPIITVESTFGEAVLLETVLLSIMNHDSAVASAAARMVQAAAGLPIMEMGSRRTSEQSAVFASRAAYVAGFASTSNLEAGFRYGIPTKGTAAHAFTLAHGSELEAFEAQVAALGKSTTLLVDTYDIPTGIDNAVIAAGVGLGGIRIDSGDLFEETVRARRQLDELGARDTKIVVSSDIDEYVIDELLSQDAPIDMVGAGTRVVTGSGSPTAGMVYKLVEIEQVDGSMRPVTKKAASKGSLGGRKSAFRLLDGAGIATGEVLCQAGDEVPAAARPLQVHAVQAGRVVHCPDLDEVRAHHRACMGELPAEAKSVTASDAYIVASAGR